MRCRSGSLEVGFTSYLLRVGKGVRPGAPARAPPRECALFRAEPVRAVPVRPVPVRAVPVRAQRGAPVTASAARTSCSESAKLSCLGKRLLSSPSLRASSLASAKPSCPRARDRSACTAVGWPSRAVQSGAHAEPASLAQG